MTVIQYTQPECSLFDSTIFGPIRSRRLGNSLGINLLPSDSKLCNFDCIYCECGWSEKNKEAKKKFPSKEIVAEQLEKRLQKLKDDGAMLDSITFAGNGEPTLHPDFPAIIEDVRSFRNKYFPEAKISVLTNGSTLGKEKVKIALHSIENPIIKLDAGSELQYSLVNKPLGNKGLTWLIEKLKDFKGNMIIQSLFLRGSHNGHQIDNSSPGEIEKWLKIIKQVRPKLVMIYSIDRPTPEVNLEKLSRERLDQIAAKVQRSGIETQVN